MTSKERHWEPTGSAPGTPPPAGAYSPAVRAGDFIFVAGQVPKDPATGKIVGDDIRSQADQTLRNLSAVLVASGAALSDVVSVTVYLSDEDHWPTYNEVHASFFEPPYPVRAVVGARLRGILVEVSAVAYVKTSHR